MAEDEKEYEGCRPGWKPDETAAERDENPWPIEDQVKSEQAHWKLEQEAAAQAESESVVPPTDSVDPPTPADPPVSAGNSKTDEDE